MFDRLTNLAGLIGFATALSVPVPVIAANNYVVGVVPQFATQIISMPNLGGLELTKKIRSDESALKEKGVHMPIVACSANAMNDDQVSGIDAGVDAYLTKPFQKAQLADVLHSAFSAKQSA